MKFNKELIANKVICLSGNSVELDSDIINIIISYSNNEIFPNLSEKGVKLWYINPTKFTITKDSIFNSKHIVVTTLDGDDPRVLLSGHHPIIIINNAHLMKRELLNDIYYALYDGGTLIIVGNDSNDNQSIYEWAMNNADIVIRYIERRNSTF